MPKTVTTEPNTLDPNSTKRQRKKQAKQEAKVMLKIGQAKKNVKKAQKKFTRAQSYLDENQTHLQGLEEKLQQIRTTGEPQALVSQTSPDASSETQPEAAQTPAVIDEVYQEPELVADSPALEADIATDTLSDTSDAAAQEEATPEI